MQKNLPKYPLNDNHKYLNYSLYNLMHRCYKELKAQLYQRLFLLKQMLILFP